MHRMKLTRVGFLVLDELFFLVVVLPRSQVIYHTFTKESILTLLLMSQQKRFLISARDPNHRRYISG